MKYLQSLTMLLAGAAMFAFSQGAYADCGECGSEGDHAHQGKKGKHMEKAEKMGQHSKAEISVSALATLLKADAVPVLVDARGGKYDDGRRIPGAETLTPDASEEKIKATIPDKETLVVAYCANPQCPASSQLGKRLHKLGYKNVLELPAGIDGWSEAGHEVENVE